ncbi:thioredoxin-related transmembrane protein 1 isoform X2 [Periplaneta americana]|uniref:thioredoxin-related transmembrane protein 1 isoform X2 n=1 Tax=Periplaneta americana TaxID=6978 RepID=UPI0037E905B3
MAVNMWGKLLKQSLFILLIELYFVIGKRNVVQLNEDNWTEMLEKEWMVEFVMDGEFRQYRGARDKDAFISFVEDKKWKTIDAIPSWKSPASLQMSVVSYFFKLSQVLRAVHNKLMEEYGMPTWGSYLIFAVATIIIGALLGLVLVCVIDLIYPPKPVIVQTPTEQKFEKNKGEKDGYEDGSKHASGDELEEDDDDDDDDVIKDDLVDDEGSAATQSGSETEVKGEEESPNVRKRKPRKAD